MPIVPSLVRKIVRTSIRILCSTLFFLLLCEGAVRIVMPVDTFIAVPTRWDRSCGFRMTENSRGSIRRPEYSCELRINSHGLRERETPFKAPAGERRILLLGDSYTCGFGVAPEQTFGRVVESLSGLRTINAGIGATGTAHQLAYYLDEGRRYGAELVVLAFVPNDFRDSAKSGLFSLDNGALLRHDARQTIATWMLRILRRVPGYYVISANSHAHALFKQRFALWWYGRRGGGGRATASAGAMPQGHQDLSLRLVQELATAVRADNAELLVVMVPMAPGLDVSEQPMRNLASRLRDSGVDVLELDRYRDALVAEGIETYFPDDCHWNAVGHRRYGLRIAAAVKDVLEREKAK